MTRLIAIALALAGCGVQRLSQDVYERQMAAAAYDAAGRAAEAAEQRSHIAKDQAALERREYAVPPTPYP